MRGDQTRLGDNSEVHEEPAHGRLLGGLLLGARGALRSLGGDAQVTENCSLLEARVVAGLKGVLGARTLELAAAGAEGPAARTPR